MLKIFGLFLFSFAVVGCSSSDIATFQKVVAALEEHNEQNQPEPNSPPSPTPTENGGSEAGPFDIPEATVSADAPIIQAGDLREKALWNDPSVLKENGRYTMYMTTSIEEPFDPPILPFKASSADGQNWILDSQQPVLTAQGGPYDSVETPSVVKFGGKYHMFFTGVYPEGQASPMSIGHATSQDGNSWQIKSWELLKATGDNAWNGYLVGEPGAVVVEGQLYVFFSAVGARAGSDIPLQTLGLITSADGQKFSAPHPILGQGAMYPLSEGYAGYSSPTAVYENGKIHVFYSVVNVDKNQNPEWQQVAIHHAWTVPGGNGFTEDDQALLTRDSTSWTSGEVLAPSVIRDGSTAKMWFGGHVALSELAPLINRGIKGPEFGIGYATVPASAIFD